MAIRRGKNTSYDIRHNQLSAEILHHLYYPRLLLFYPKPLCAYFFATESQPFGF